MDEQITVNYAVIDEIVADILRIVDKTQSYAQKKKYILRSEGASATNTDQSLILLAEYANILAGVMRGAALSIHTAKNKMMEADEVLAQSLTAQNGPKASIANTEDSNH